MKQYIIFDAEFKFLNILWESEPVSSTELSKICLQKIGWKKSTTFNMIKNLVEKDIIQNKNAIVTSLVKKNQVQKYESGSIVDKKFNGSLPLFLSAFLDNKKISPEEAEELKKIIEEATK